MDKQRSRISTTPLIWDGEYYVTTYAIDNGWWTQGTLGWWFASRRFFQLNNLLIGTFTPVKIIHTHVQKDSK